MSQALLASVAAFGWHLGDLALNRKSASKMQRLWIGVGLGWSAFMFVKLVYDSRKIKYITTKS